MGSSPDACSESHLVRVCNRCKTACNCTREEARVHLIRCRVARGLRKASRIAVPAVLAGLLLSACAADASLDPRPRRVRQPARRRAVVVPLHRRHRRLRPRHGARAPRAPASSAGHAAPPGRYRRGRGGGRRRSGGHPDDQLRLRPQRPHRLAAAEGPAGGEHRRGRAPVVVGGPLPGAGVRDRQRDPHPGRPDRRRPPHHGRREPQLLGATAHAQDRPDRRPHQHHLAAGGPRRHLQGPVRGVLRAAARAHGLPRRGPEPGRLPGLARAAAGDAGPDHRARAARAHRLRERLLRVLPHRARDDGRREGGARPDAPRDAPADRRRHRCPTRRATSPAGSPTPRPSNPGTTCRRSPCRRTTCAPSSRSWRPGATTRRRAARPRRRRHPRSP